MAQPAFGILVLPGYAGNQVSPKRIPPDHCPVYFRLCDPEVEKAERLSRLYFQRYIRSGDRCCPVAYR